jgi:hypothetical protein
VPANEADQYLKTGKASQVKKGWINADYLRGSHLEPEIAKVECPTSAPKLSIKNQIGDLGIHTDEVTKEVEDRVEKTSKTCPAHMANVEKSDAERADGKPIGSEKHENMLHRFLHSIAHLFETNPREKPTADQKKAIDLLARTIYGEMRSCHYELGSRYSMAVARVALNRAQNCQENAKCAYVDHAVAKNEDFNSKNEDGLAHAMVEVLGMPAQWKVWNKQNPNCAKLMCVENDEPSLAVFREDLKIATSIIMNPEKFKKDTDSLASANGYSSGAAEPARGCVPLRGVNVRGVPVDRQSCFVAYHCR